MCQILHYKVAFEDHICIFLCLQTAGSCELLTCCSITPALPSWHGKVWYKMVQSSFRVKETVDLTIWKTNGENTYFEAEILDLGYWINLAPTVKWAIKQKSMSHPTVQYSSSVHLFMIFSLTKITLNFLFLF